MRIKETQLQLYAPCETELSPLLNSCFFSLLYKLKSMTRSDGSVVVVVVQEAGNAFFWLR